ncbi:MAG TPA: tetratricopeptide repeat protein [Chitinophaga sp.]|uniref:tetratricopeptide repeat protein n=1 Tax=Chitinophaga sp. TaxID=1869181 RepID=UPI002C4CCF8D|nr:tetratricopeptide repeat protein [Chitinophaga sp.]HVI47652.1 tetratricopeptide repeat protein [Chitinophaga sp.]
MSMHEVESLVELSVLCLDNSSNEQLDRRSLFYNLYRLQGQFDTGFTHFRVMDILVKHKFVYTFPVMAHPAYAQHQRFFDELAAAGKFSFIYEQPEKPWDAESNPVAAYTAPDAAANAYVLYCDAGSSLWKAMVAAGSLKGNAAIAPQEIPVFSLALTLAEEAGRQEDKYLLGLWYQLLPYMVMNAEYSGEPIDTESLKAILDIVLAHNAIEEATLPPSDELPVGGQLGEFCAWWYAPAAGLMKPSADEPAGLPSPNGQEPTFRTSVWCSEQVRDLLQEVSNTIHQMEDNGADEATQQQVEAKISQALQYADEGLELAPEDTTLLMNKGSLLLLQQQYDAALACYDKAMSIEPDNAYVYLNRGILFCNIDRIPEAIGSFEKLLQLEPGNEFGKQWLSYLKDNGQQ